MVQSKRKYRIVREKYVLVKNPFVWTRDENETAGTMRQWYAIWFPLGTVIADRGYLGCSYSWCIINVGLTWPSRSTRIRGIAAKRPTADGPYKDLYYLCMCTGSLFQDKRRPGTRSPSRLWSSKAWTFLRKVPENYCVPTAAQMLYPRISETSLRSVSRILSEEKQLVFYSSDSPRSKVQATSSNAWFTLTGPFSRVKVPAILDRKQEHFRNELNCVCQVLIFNFYR